MATSRPPGGSMENAERIWRRSASRRRRCTPGLTENGGFMSTTDGANPGRRSAMDSALCRFTVTSGKSLVRSPARVGASSLR